MESFRQDFNSKKTVESPEVALEKGNEKPDGFEEASDVAGTQQSDEREAEELQMKMKDEQVSEERMAAARMVIESGRESEAEDYESSEEMSVVTEDVPVTTQKNKEINRREFLKKAVHVGAAFAADAVVPGGLVKEALANEDDDLMKKVEQWKEDMKNGVDEETVELKESVAKWNERKEDIAQSLGGVAENLKFVKEEFGYKDPRSIPVLNVAERDMLIFRQFLEQEEKGVAPADFDIMGLGLVEGMQHYDLKWSREAIDAENRKLEQEGALNAGVGGFEKCPGWSNERLRSELEAMHEKRWLYGNISSFEYVDEEKESTNKTYKLAGVAFHDGLDLTSKKSGKEKIEIYKSAGEMSSDEMLELMSHEIAHHQDWETSNCLTMNERLQFLREVTEHFDSDDRWHFPYVELDIPDEHGMRDSSEHSGEGEVNPSHAQKQLQLKEYWAELVSVYDMRGDDLKEHHPDDFNLVDRWKKRISEKP